MSTRNAALSALTATTKILDQHPFRIAGTEECRAAARAVSETLVPVCTKVREESFTLHPRALWWLGRVLAVIAVAAAALLAAGTGFTYAAAVLTLTGFLYGASQYVFYGTLFDGLFRPAEGINVVGNLEPEGSVERQVILVGHHDSPYVFNFLERFPRIAFPRFLLGIAGYLWVTGCALWRSVAGICAGGPVAARGTCLVLTCVAALCAAQLFFMMSRKRSPGAGDNLNSVSMGREIAQLFRAKRDGGNPLRRTRLIVLSTDGEEIGQRGAMAYVKKHRIELRATPTFVLNLDSIYYRKDLAVLTRDRNCTCRLSRAMADDLCDIAAAQGIALRRMAIPFGGGGTDAAQFALAGIEATSIIAQPTGLFSGDHLYHTTRDVPERIEVEAVNAVLRLATAYVRKIDSNEEPAC